MPDREPEDVEAAEHLGERRGRGPVDDELAGVRPAVEAPVANRQQAKLRERHRAGRLPEAVLQGRLQRCGQRPDRLLQRVERDDEQGKGEEPEHYAGSKRGDSVPPASRTTRRGASAADSISTKPLVIQAFRYYGTSAHGPRVGKGWGVQRRTPIVFVLAALLAAVAGSAAGRGASAAGPPGGEPPGLAKARAAKAKHEDKILDTAGVAGIGVGVNKAGKAVVKVYKERPDADVPATLDGVEVDSVTTGIIEARAAPTDRFPRPVPIGVSAGLHDFGSGTLGARVTDGTHVFALSNNHVFAGINSASVGEAITQPGSADGGMDPADRIGTLYAYQTINFSAGSTNTIDAAIALVSTANVGTATPDDGYGTPSTVTAQAFPGLAVQKYGRTTGFQPGHRGRDERLRRRLLPTPLQHVLPAGALRQPDLDLSRDLQCGRGLRLPNRHPERQPARRAPLRRR